MEEPNMVSEGQLHERCGLLADGFIVDWTTQVKHGCQH